MKNKTIIIIAIAIAAYFLYKKATYRDPRMWYSNGNTSNNAKNTYHPIVSKPRCPECGGDLSFIDGGPYAYNCKNCGKMFNGYEIPL